jgi:hypothetical protein
MSRYGLAALLLTLQGGCLALLASAGKMSVIPHSFKHWLATALKGYTSAAWVGMQALYRLHWRCS